jgi:hypothetical protein
LVPIHSLDRCIGKTIGIGRYISLINMHSHSGGIHVFDTLLRSTPQGQQAWLASVRWASNGRRSRPRNFIAVCERRWSMQQWSWHPRGSLTLSPGENIHV